MQFIMLVAIMALLCMSFGCAPAVYHPEPPVAHPKVFRKPVGPGTVPPAWYGRDPAVGGWFDPWYVNPYMQ
jgi:hypothetical protein